jgi:ABC-type transport system substrate-binding protein
MRLLRFIVLGAALLGLASAAGAQEPRKVLRVAFNEPETSFDPVKVDDIYSRVITGHIFESPYAYDPLAQPAKIRPLTAAAMPEHSADYRAWTIRLQPGIYFADDPAFKGKRRELVAQDYVYAIERTMDPANKSANVSYVEDAHIVGLGALRERALKTGRFDYDATVQGLRALDRYTLRVELEQPRPRIVETLFAESDLFGAEAREVVEHYGQDIDAHPVGTGPFKLKQWRRASLIVLERNPQFREMHFDAEPAPDDVEGQAILAQLKGRRLPMVDEVQVAIIEEPQPDWLAFLNGQIDMLGTTANSVPPNFINVATPGGKLAPNLAKRGIVAHRMVNADTTYAVFNMEDPIVGGYTPDKVALRRAIGLAYDTEREIRLIRNDQAVPAQSHVLPHTSGYDPKFKSEMSDYDPARAKALLDLYGYVDRNGDGWREMPDGSPLVLRMATQTDQFTRQLDEQWKHDMDAVGLKMVFEPAQWPENLKRAKAGSFMMWKLGVSAAGADGQDAFSAMYSPQKGAQNMSRFKLPAMDALYDKMSTLPDGPERDALFLEGKKIEIAYMPLKDATHRIVTDLTHPWLLGYRRPLFWLDWWEYVDIDTALRDRMLKR